MVEWTFSGNSLLHGLTPTHRLTDIHMLHLGGNSRQGGNVPLVSIVCLQLMSAWLGRTSISLLISAGCRGLAAMFRFDSPAIDDQRAEAICRPLSGMRSAVKVVMSSTSAEERTGAERSHAHASRCHFWLSRWMIRSKLV